MEAEKLFCILCSKIFLLVNLGSIFFPPLQIDGLVVLVLRKNVVTFLTFLSLYSYT